MLLDPKFYQYERVYNRVTKEVGEITRSYVAEGVQMYRVSFPVVRDSSLHEHHVSDWEENRLELLRITPEFDHAKPL